MSTEHHESQYAVITHTNDLWGGVKGHFFSKSGHVAHQIKVEDVYTYNQGNTLKLHTPLTSGDVQMQVYFL